MTPQNIVSGLIPNCASLVVKSEIKKLISITKSRSGKHYPDYTIANAPKIRRSRTVKSAIFFKTVKKPRTSRYTQREKYRYNIMRFFEDKPFAYLNQFRRFIIDRPTPFYVDIYIELRMKYDAKVQRHQQRLYKKAVARRAYEQALKDKSFTCLEIEEWSPTPTEEILLGLTDLVFLDVGQEEIKPPKPKLKPQPLPKWNKTFQIFKKEKPRERNLFLLQVLRFKIARLVANRMTAHSRFYLDNRVKISRHSNMSYVQRLVAKGQAKFQAGDGVEETAPEPVVVEDKAGNVCIQSQRQESKARIPSELVSPSIFAGDQVHIFPTLQDRWLQLKTFDWSTDQPRGTDLYAGIMPAHSVELRKNSPLFTPFMQYSYWAGDLEFKIQVNSNKFQVGQLQISWLYDTSADEKVSVRENVYSLSQAPHTLINAGSSNPAYLSIGYINPYTALPIIRSNQDPNCLNLGKLYIKVLNQLNTSANAHHKCSVTLFIKFPNSRFYGMRNRDVGKYVSPQMMPAAAIVGAVAAEKILEQINPAPNQDNPSYTGSRIPVQPTALQSISSGDNSTEIMHTLRLNSLATTPQLVNGFDEMNINYVARKYGLLKTIEWSADHSAGALLQSLDASPQPSLMDIPHIQMQSNDCYYMPPVAVMSSLFSFWRGCLELRLDIVASQFHTGRILVSYIPRVLDNVTLEQAIGSPHVVFDIAEKQSFTFTVPYITNRLWWPRRLGYINPKDQVDPPGRVHIFVLNSLIPMESVPDKVKINLYWRAGDNFEVSVPAQPSFGTAFWTTEDKPSSEVRAEPGYYPWYWGYYGDFYNGKKAIARYGKGWQHVAQFFNIKFKAYYSMDQKYKNNFPQLKKNDGTMFTPQWFGGIDLNDGYGMVYMGVFETEENAKKYAALDQKDYSLFMDVSQDDDGPWCKDNPVFQEHVVQSEDSDFDTLSMDSLRSRIYSKPQMDERTRTDKPCAPLICPAADVGKITMGEDFKSLKSLCRRYQVYAFSGSATSSQAGDVDFQFPVVPQGLDLDIAKTEKEKRYFQKYVRDGVIPIVMSGYKFFRGSMRYQLVFLPQKDITVWAQHRPDYQMDKFKIIRPSGIHTGQNLINTGYAMAVQCTSVNHVLPIEVPYYLPLTYMYLQRPNTKLAHVLPASSLGTVNVGVESDDKAKDLRYSVVVFYSLGDDANASCFQGFPPMIPLDTIPPPSSVLKASRILKEYAKPQGLLDGITGIVKGKMKHEIEVPHLQETAEAVKELTSAVTTTGVLPACESFANFLSNLGDSIASLSVDFISHLGHICMNPTPKVIAWAIGSLLVKLNLITFKFINIIITAILKFMKYVKLLDKDYVIRDDYVHKLDDKTTQVLKEMRDKVYATPQSGDTSIVSYISVGFAAVSQVLSMTINPPTDLNRFKNVLLKDLPNNLRTSNYMFIFIRNNLEFFRNLMQYCIGFVHKDRIFEQMLEDDMHPIAEWCDEAHILLDPKYDEKTYAKDSQWSDRLEYAYILGTKFNKGFLSLTSCEPNLRSTYQVFNSLYIRISKKRETMFKRGISAVSRREPFTVWVAGKPGCGKSQMASTVIPRMLRHAGITYDGEAIFPLSTGANYWNGCRNQPCIYLDDFLNVRLGDLLPTAVRDFCAIKSPAPLNPPQAHLEDKEARYSPEICWVNSNSDFPSIQGTDDAMLWRRREILIRSQLKVHIVAAGFSNITDDKDKFKEFVKKNNICLSEFEHLEFFVARKESCATTEWDGPMNFHDLLPILHKRFDKYRTDQMQLFQNRMDEYKKSIVASCTVDDIDLMQTRERYKRMLTFMSTTTMAESMTFKEYMRLASLYIQGKSLSKETVAVLCEMQNQHIEKLMATPQGNEVDMRVYTDAELYKIDTTKCDTLKDFITHHLRPLIPNTYSKEFDVALKDCDFVDAVSLEKQKENEVVLETDFKAIAVPIIDEFKSKIYLDESQSENVKRKFNFGESGYDILGLYKLCFFICLSYSILYEMAIVKEDSNKKLMAVISKCINELFKTLSNFDLIGRRDFYAKFISILRELFYRKEHCIHYEFCEQWFFMHEDKNVKHARWCTHDGIDILEKGCSKTCPWQWDGVIEFESIHWFYKQADRDSLCNLNKPPYVLKRFPYDIFNKPASTSDIAVEVSPQEKAKIKTEIEVNQVKSELGIWIRTKTKLGSFYTRYMLPAFKMAWKVLKYVIPFVLILGSIWYLATGGKSYSEMDDEQQGSALLKGAVAGCATAYVAEKVGNINAELADSNFLYAKAAYYDHLSQCGKVPNMKTVEDTEAIERALYESQIHNSGDVKNLKIKTKDPKPPIFNYSKPQAGDQQITQTITKIVKNTAFLARYENGIMGYPNRIVFITENIALVLNHYLNAEMEDVVLTCNDKSKFYFKMSDLRKRAIKGPGDLAFVKFPGVPFKQNLIKQIAPCESHTKPKGLCQMIETDSQKCMVHPVTIRIKSDVKSRDDKGNIITTEHAYAYDWDGTGRCCSLLLDPSLNKPIIGVHVAGCLGEGYAEPIMSEFFNQWSELEPSSDFVGVTLNSEPSDKMDGDFVPIGITCTGMNHYQSGVSQIVPSSIYEKIWPHVTEPAPLQKNDSRVPIENYSPLWSGVSLMCKPVKNFSTEDIISVTHVMRQRILSLAQPVYTTIGVLTYQIAVCGLPGDYFKGVDMHTSEGFPFSRYRPSGASNKSWLFSLEQTSSELFPVRLTRMNRYLHELITSKNRQRVKGIIPVTIFDDCLKDARLPLEKIKVPGKTRIFSTSPVDYTIVCKQFFGEFLAAFKNARLSLNHAIGVAPDGPEWSKLVRFLTRVDGVFVMGDYKNFGPSLNSQLLRELARIACDWYMHYNGTNETPENDRIRKSLIEEGVHAYHCTADVVWQALAGLPSGCPMTVEWNSLVNEGYILLAWLHIMREEPMYAALHRFYEHVALVTYGDDLIMCISHQVKELFNGITISKFLAEHNIIFTDVNKSQEPVKYHTNLEDCNFLKRGFQPHPKLNNQWLAPLNEIESVREVVNWTHQHPDLKLATTISIEACNMNAYSLGPDKFQHIHDLLNKALIDLKSDKILRTWDEIDKIHFKDFYFRN